MNEFKVNNSIRLNKAHIRWLLLLGIGVACINTYFNYSTLKPKAELSQNYLAKTPVNKTKSAQNQNQSQNKDKPQVDGESTAGDSIAIRPLKLTISVDNPTYLKVKVGQAISKGDVISDNSLERDRLDKQRKSLLLQINNIKSKTIPAPSEPKKPPVLVPLPNANFLEESAQIAQAQLKLQQAQETLKSRTQLLQTDNPEKRSNVENAESAMQQASEKVKEQEELLKNMQDMRLDTPIIRHEEAKLKSIQSEMNQAQSALERERAALNASAIASSQELQNLKVAVQIAQSNLQMATSKLETAKSNRKLLEYRASIESTQRIEQENQFNLSYSQQQQQYAQATRDREYQLAQLRIQLSAIDDKLAQIPVVRSPKNGYIRKIRPWTGNNGKYTTIITISPTAVTKPVTSKRPS
jgi:multidrug resistance efflux pump